MRNNLLFVLLIFCWGLSWPISKVALVDMPPIWFSAARTWVGMAVLLALLACLKKLRLPKRQDLPIIISFGIFQIGLFLILLNVGLSKVDAGRSAFLVYSTPLWATPIAMLMGEKLSPLKAAGLVLGLVGIGILFNPSLINWHDQQALIGNGMLLLAAIVWAITIIHGRYATWHSEAIYLVPWQLILATIPITVAAVWLEPGPTIHWTSTVIGSILYNGIFATAIAYWIMNIVVQNYSVITTTLCLLGVPIVGLLSSMWMLGETLSRSMTLAILLLLCGLVCITFANNPQKELACEP